MNLNNRFYKLICSEIKGQGSFLFFTIDIQLIIHHLFLIQHQLFSNTIFTLFHITLLSHTILLIQQKSCNENFIDVPGLEVSGFLFTVSSVCVCIRAHAVIQSSSYG